MEWFYAKDGQQLGPVSSQELESLIKNGSISENSLVWREGMPEWKPAKEVLTLPGTSEPTAAAPSEPAPAQPDPLPAASQPEPAASQPAPAASQPAPAASQPAPAASQPAPVATLGGAAPIAPGTVNPYLWQSICCIVLCCWPFAIPALIASLKVNPALERGDLAEAEAASAQAKKWCLVSAIVAVVVWVLYLGFVLLLGGMGALA